MNSRLPPSIPCGYEPGLPLPDILFHKKTIRLATKETDFLADHILPDLLPHLEIICSDRNSPRQ
jgi:hypothetical protein